jgi:hypothetical protein
VRDLFWSAVIKLRRAVPRGRSWPPDLSGRGIEIGAHGRPIPGIEPFYVDRFREFVEEKCLADVLSTASARRSPT